MKLTIHPLTPDLWPALEDLFGKRGASNGCWCMYGRIGAAYRKRSPERNRTEFRAIVKRGPPPGLLAFDGDLAVGWCQLTPRDALPALDRVWRLRRVDDVPVWSLSCIYVRIGYRRRGVTSRLIAAALKAAKRAGAPAVEAYPFDAEVSPSASGCGYASTLRAGGIQDHRPTHAGAAYRASRSEGPSHQDVWLSDRDATHCCHERHYSREIVASFNDCINRKDGSDQMRA